MIPAFIAGLAAGYAIAIPVGAIAAYLIALGTRAPWRVAAGGALGAAAADGIYASAAVVGGTLLASRISSVERPLHWVAAIVLFAVGVLMLRNAIRQPATTPADPGFTPAAAVATSTRAFIVVFGLTLVNPSTIVYFAVVVAGSSIDGSGDAMAQVAFVAGAFVASASWQLVLVTAGSTLRRFLTSPRARRATTMVGAPVVIALAVRSLLAA